MQRFFSYMGASIGLERHDTAQEARVAVQAAADARDGGWESESTESWCWGEVREVMVDTDTPEGPLCSLAAVPNPEMESLRAELAALRARVGSVVATLQEMEANHRQGVRSLAHGGYSFERAEAYEHAIDLLSEALEAPGGEE